MGSEVFVLFCSWGKKIIPLMLHMFPHHILVSDLFRTWIDEPCWICAWLLLINSAQYLTSKLFCPSAKCYIMRLLVSHWNMHHTGHRGHVQISCGQWLGFCFCVCVLFFNQFHKIGCLWSLKSLVWICWQPFQIWPVIPLLCDQQWKRTQ